MRLHVHYSQTITLHNTNVDTCLCYVTRFLLHFLVILTVGWKPDV